MRGAAATYPKIYRRAESSSTSRNASIFAAPRAMGAEPLRYESEELLALTPNLARQSLGLPIATRIDGAARRAFRSDTPPTICGADR